FRLIIIHCLVYMSVLNKKKDGLQVDILLSHSIAAELSVNVISEIKNYLQSEKAFNVLEKVRDLINDTGHVKLLCKGNHARHSIFCK
ncbi:hypothetical protein PMAYCL1PPCAC_25222, partial [Pristionchus mayeri]